MANWVSEPLWTGPGSGSVSTYWWREFRRASHVRLGGVPRTVEGISCSARYSGSQFLAMPKTPYLNRVVRTRIHTRFRSDQAMPW